LATLETHVIKKGMSMYALANAGNYEAPEKMSQAERKLVELAKTIQTDYMAGAISPQQVLEAAAAHFQTNEFTQMCRGMPNTIHTEPDRYFLDGGAYNYDEEEEEQADNPHAYSIAGLSQAEIDERRLLLSFDPDIPEDTTYDWVTSNWTLPDPEPRSQEEMTRVLPGEDVNRVAAPCCTACYTEVLYAITMKCTHMLCLPCFERDDLTHCPYCQVWKRRAAISHIGTLTLMRKKDSRLIERAAVTQEAQLQLAAAEAGERTETERQRDIEAINAVLRADGIEDPEAYRAQLRSAARTRERRANAASIEAHSERTSQASLGQVC
jgi:hypothetical protein